MIIIFDIVGAGAQYDCGSYARLRGRRHTPTASPMAHGGGAVSEGPDSFMTTVAEDGRMEVFWSEGQQSLQQGMESLTLSDHAEVQRSINMAWSLYDMKRALKIKVRGRRGSRHDHSIAIVHRAGEAMHDSILGSLSLGMRGLAHVVFSLESQPEGRHNYKGPNQFYRLKSHRKGLRLRGSH